MQRVDRLTSAAGPSACDTRLSGYQGCIACKLWDSWDPKSRSARSTAVDVSICQQVCVHPDHGDYEGYNDQRFPSSLNRDIFRLDEPEATKISKLHPGQSSPVLMFYRRKKKTPQEKKKRLSTSSIGPIPRLFR